MNRRKPIIVFKLWVRILIVIIISFFLVTAIFLIISSINYAKSQSNQLLYNYKIIKGIDYNVNLLDNSFIEEKTQAANGMYISELVNTLDINFKYRFSGNLTTDIKYSYAINSLILGNYGTDEEGDNRNIWTKEYKIKEEEFKTAEDVSSYSIDEKIVIDYLSYKKEYESFRKNLNISLITQLKVVLTVKMETTIEGKQVLEQQEMSLLIPLGVQAFSISEQYDKITNKDLYKNENVINPFDLNQMKIAIVLLIVSILVFISSFTKIFNIRKRTIYSKRLSRIMKLYGEIIVEILDPIPSNEYKVINVKDIEEMIDLEEELEIPINFFESIKKHEGEFFIIHNEIMYKYILKDIE